MKSITCRFRKDNILKWGKNGKKRAKRGAAAAGPPLLPRAQGRRAGPEDERPQAAPGPAALCGPRAAGKQARNEGKRAHARPAPALRQGAVFVILNTLYARGPKRAARRRAGPGRGAHGAQRRRAQKGETL